MIIKLVRRHQTTHTHKHTHISNFTALEHGIRTGKIDTPEKRNEWEKNERTRIILYYDLCQCKLKYYFWLTLGKLSTHTSYSIHKPTLSKSHSNTHTRTRLHSFTAARVASFHSVNLNEISGHTGKEIDKKRFFCHPKCQQFS